MCTGARLRRFAGRSFVSVRNLPNHARRGSPKWILAGGLVLSGTSLFQIKTNCLSLEDPAPMIDAGSAAADAKGSANSPFDMLVRNQFATGGLAVLAGGVGVAMLRSTARLTWASIVRRLVVRAEFDSRDDSYRWVIAWLAEHPHYAKSKRFSVLTTLKRLGASSMEADAASGHAEGAANVLLIPSGTSILRHQGRWMMVDRNREDEGKSNPTGRERESLTLHILGGTKDDLLELVNEARSRFLERQRARTAVYLIDEYGSWTHASSKPSRPADSVILGHPGQVDALLADCRRFLSAERWYGERGIPYRRGYLLHGPPGTGKTSLVAAVASELRLPIYVVSLSSPRLSDDTFAEALACAAAQCVLLLEDVDAAFVRRDVATAGGGGGGGLTFSGLLNGIDGVAAQEGRMLFMTTNHPDKLDPALVRPGRADVRVEFGRCSAEQVRSYCRHFYGAALSHRQEDELVSSVPGGSVSIAQLQGVLMQHADDPTAAAAECRTLFATAASSSSSSSPSSSSSEARGDANPP